MEVYLDNSATTRCFDKAAALMTRIMCEDYGNPSSLHRKGVEAEKYIRYAKDVIADNLKVNQKEIPLEYKYLPTTLVEKVKNISIKEVYSFLGIGKYESIKYVLVVFIRMYIFYAIII